MIFTGSSYLKMCDCGKHGWIVSDNYPSPPLFDQTSGFVQIENLKRNNSRDLLPEEEKHLKEEIVRQLPPKLLVSKSLAMASVLKAVENVPSDLTDLEEYYFCPFKDQV